jgi:hypothetical protein
MFLYVELLKRNGVNIAELVKCIKLAWAAITTDEINTLIDSLPYGFKACIRARRWYTDY